MAYLTFTIENGNSKSNMLQVDGVICDIAIPSQVDGDELQFWGAVDRNAQEVDLQLIDISVDLTIAGAKDSIKTNLQNHLCGLGAIQIKTVITGGAPAVQSADRTFESGLL